MLRDNFGRSIGYLRLSLTSVCQMRCTYCRPESFQNPRHETRLTPAEIETVVAHLMHHHGLEKVRLTGGEPTARPDLIDIISRLSRLNLTDLAMTTNGLTLATRAADYARAGLHRVNVSLDSLNPQRFSDLTGIDGLHHVLAGLDAALAAGLAPVRLNTVVVRGQNDVDLPALLRFAARKQLDIRFIELMPMGPLIDQWPERWVSEAQMRKRLEPIVHIWEPILKGHDAARRYRVYLNDGTVATVGFITPISCNFCAACNRIRIAADATLYPCLMDAPGPNLRSAIRPHFDPAALDRLLAEGLTTKRQEHPVAGSSAMITLGG